MGIISRFGDIMKSNINALLDKCEDPAKMVDETLRQLRKDLAEVKRETASVMADADLADKKVKECRADIEKNTLAAKNALKSGDEESAKKLIAKKQNLESKLASLENTAGVAQGNADKMRKMHDKLVSDIDSLETRKDAIKASVATAKAQQHMNKVASGIDTSGSIAAFERMEDKANKMLSQANAEAELNSGDDVDALADKYATGGTAQVDTELEQMKRELGL